MSLRLQIRLTIPLVCAVLAAAGDATKAAGPFGAGNVLVGDASSSLGLVCEFTRSGQLVRTLAAPYPGTFHATVRGVGVDDAGRLHIFNSPFDPYLSTYDPAEDVWQQHTHPQWGIANCYPCGGLDVLDRYIFVTDMSLAGGLEGGVIRFDGIDFSSVRFASGQSYVDLALGLDGLLYARRADLISPPPPTMVDVYDPYSMTLVRTVTLDVRALTIAVDGRGHLFGGGEGGLLEFEPDGTLVTLHAVGGGGYLYDVDMNADGELAIASDTGEVFLFDAGLQMLGSFQAGCGSFLYVALLDADRPGNHPPVADAGPNVTHVECTSPEGAPAQVNGDRSYDPDNDPLEFAWSAPGVAFDDPASVSPTGRFPLGTTLVALRVSDGTLGDEATTTVTIVDSTPPVIVGAAINPATLWLPHRRFVAVAVNYTANDTCTDNAAVACHLEVTSNESPKGSAHSVANADWEIVDDHHLWLRAERTNPRSDRTYTINIVCQDAQGNRSDAPLTVQALRHLE